jgi:hypothetical protein
VLSDAQIERYGRQILLPEVGGRGQERLLAAAVTVVGRGRAADIAALLLARAGIHHLHLDGPAAPDGMQPPATDQATTCDVLLLIDALTATPPAHAAVIADSTAGYVVALRGRPCAECFVEPAGTNPPPTIDPAIHWQVGSLAAAEVLRVLITPKSTARLHRVEPNTTGLRTIPVPATAGCPHCVFSS